MAAAKKYNSVDSKEKLMLVEIGKGKFGGYKQNLLSSPLNEFLVEFFVCTECGGVMRNACQLGVKQIPVCETCAKNRMRCQPMMQARQKIPQLRVNCPLATRGCQWNTTIQNLDEHLAECQEFIVKCKYGCGVILKRCERNDHFSNECLNRIVRCEHCQANRVYRDLKQHHTVCLEFPLLCTNNCGANLRRKQIDTHIETDCPNTTVKCRYERFGCREVVKRCEMDQHNKTNEINHLEMSTLFAVNELEQFKETNSNLSKEVQRLTEKIEQHDRTNSRLTEKLEQHDRTNSRLTEKLEQHDRTISQLKETLDARPKENQPAMIEILSPIIESLSYPIVLRERLRTRDPGLVRHEFPWQSLSLALVLENSGNGTIIYIIMKLNNANLPQTFEGRFKLTLVDRVRTKKSLTYETPVIKLKQEAKFFYMKEDRIEITMIPRKILLEDRFKTSNGDVEFTLQIQEAEYVRISREMELLKQLFTGDEIGQSKETKSRLTEKIEQQERTNSLLAEKTEQHERTNSLLTEKIEQQERTNSMLAEKTEQQEMTNSMLAEKIEQQEGAISQLKRTQDNVIEGLTYPVVLRNKLKRSDLERGKDVSSLYQTEIFEFSWQSYKLELIFKYIVEGNTISVLTKMTEGGTNNSLQKDAYEGRFKLTIIDRVNTNNSLVYETPVVKLQEQHPNVFTITSIARELILQGRFRSENGYIEFTLQIQEPEHNRTLDQITAVIKS